MGTTPCKGPANTNKAISIAILGLDNAGKTTTARVLEKAPVDSVAPTVGFSQTEITHKNERIKLIDLGGAKTFREAWRHYYDDAYGFVYVLDSSEENRLSENRDVLKRLLQEEKVKGKPILILANKQDKAEALDKNAILEDLKIERLANESETLCRVELCTAKSLSRNGKNSKMDEAIRHGFDWLIKVIYENYDKIHKRVEQDVQKRTETEQRAKRERQERVQKLREEREKQEGSQHNSDEDEDTIKNGFVPIDRAIKNAERNASEKPTKDKSNRLPSSEKLKHKTVNEYPSLPPVPAPRSSSHTRRVINDDNSDDPERPRRHSTDTSPRRKESPIPRSVSSNLDENQQVDSTDEQGSIRSVTRKKKKVIGAGRGRLNGDSLPPLAPSSAASRREDFPISKGPPVGTPRPQATVAQWAITSPTPQGAAEKLTTITSDNEVDDDEDKYKSVKSSKRIVSPHPSTTNRIVHDKKNQLTTAKNDTDDNDENLINSDYKRSSRDKRQKNLNNDDDDNDGITSRRSLSAQKLNPKLNNGEDADDYRTPSRPRRQIDINKKNDDENDKDNDDRENNSRKTSARQKSRSKFNDDSDRDDNVDRPSSVRKRNNSKENDRSSKGNNDQNDDNDDDFNSRSSRRTPSARKTTSGNSSHRSHS